VVAVDGKAENQAVRFELLVGLLSAHKLRFENRGNRVEWQERDDFEVALPGLRRDCGRGRRI
jgi:hypothetical protein